MNSVCWPASIIACSCSAGRAQRGVPGSWYDLLLAPPLIAMDVVTEDAGNSNAPPLGHVRVCRDG
jgi:hypothetical protein